MGTDFTDLSTIGDGLTITGGTILVTLIALLASLGATIPVLSAGTPLAIFENLAAALFLAYAIYALLSHFIGDDFSGAATIFTVLSVWLGLSLQNVLSIGMASNWVYSSAYQAAMGSNEIVLVVLAGILTPVVFYFTRRWG